MSVLKRGDNPVSEQDKADIRNGIGLGTAALLNAPSSGNASSSQLVKGDDTRLSDARTPSAHTHTASQVTDFSTAADARIAAASINALSDVTVTSPSSGQVLKWNGSAWINDTDSGGGGGGSTNLSYTASPTNGVVASDTGTDATLTLADGTNAGLMAPAQHTKLSDIASGATANSSDATLLDRANHTGSQAISTVTGLQAALDGKLPSTDASVTNAREWSAATVDQAEAEAGTATTRRAWTAQRVWQAITKALGGVSVTNTPSSGQVLKATSGTTAAWAADETGGSGGGANLSYTASATGGTVVSDSGTDATLPLVDGTNAGLMAPAQHTKLAGVATGATANDTNSQLRDRATHTGTQAAGTITGLSGVATSGAYGDLSGRPTLGTAAATDASAYATAAQGIDAREWTAETIDQAEAEAGTATTRRAFTAQRVFQATAAWWAASSAKTKLDGIAAGATANSSDATLLDRANHTGSQAISTVTGLQTALDGLMPVGTLIDVSAGVTLTPAMNGHRFDTASTSRAFTVPSALGGAFVGVTVHGPCTWVASGTTVTDRRQTGQGYDLCQLIQVRINTYVLVGTSV